MVASDKTKCDWFIVDDKTYDAGRMLSTIKRTKRKLDDMGHPLRLIFVDYLQMFMWKWQRIFSRQTYRD